MNKKEELIKKITDETVNQNIDWQIASTSSVSDYVPNSPNIIRVIKTDYREFTFYFVEQKFRHTDPDTEDIFEYVESFILGEKNGQLVVRIEPNEIADYTYDAFCNAVKGKIEETALDELLDNGSAQ